MLDSNPAHEVREVIAVPVDPTALLRDSVSTSPPRTPRDSTVRAYRDSVLALDQRFQAERAALNREARSLAALDRRTREYHTRYDAFRKREMDAESLRTTRDRLRAHVGRVESPSDTPRAGSVNFTARFAIDAATDGTRQTVVSRAEQDTVVLPLSRGRWWVGVARERAIPPTWTTCAVPDDKLVDLRRMVPPR